MKLKSSFVVALAALTIGAVCLAPAGSSSTGAVQSLAKYTVVKCTVEKKPEFLFAADETFLIEERSGKTWYLHVTATTKWEQIFANPPVPQGGTWVLVQGSYPFANSDYPTPPEFYSTPHLYNVQSGKAYTLIGTRGSYSWHATIGP